MDFKEILQTIKRIVSVKSEVTHESHGLCTENSDGCVVRCLSLRFCNRENCVDRWQNADRNRAHARTVFDRVRTNIAHKRDSGFVRFEERLKSASIAITWITMKHACECVCKIKGCGHASRNQDFRHRNRHLCVVCVHPGFEIEMCWMLIVPVEAQRAH